MVAALGALVVPATADAAAKTPVITKVTPKNVSVGETLIVNGKNFKVGKGKNTLLFKRDGGKALFVKAGLATKKQIAVVIPKKLETYMANSAGKPVAGALPHPRAREQAEQGVHGDQRLAGHRPREAQGRPRPGRRSRPTATATATACSTASTPTTTTTCWPTRSRSSSS